MLKFNDREVTTIYNEKLPRAGVPDRILTGITFAEETGSQKGIIIRYYNKPLIRDEAVISRRVNYRQRSRWHPQIEDF